MPLHDLDLLYHALCLQIMRMYSLLSRPQPGSEVNFIQFAASILEKEIITADVFVSSVISTSSCAFRYQNQKLIELKFIMYDCMSEGLAALDTGGGGSLANTTPFQARS